MRQIIIIHGGQSFGTHERYIQNLRTSDIDYGRLKHQKKWKSWIAEQMPDADVLLPSFPNGSNAVYDEWVIYFEKILPFLTTDVQLVGHSLGAMFLAKYLQDNLLGHTARRLILISGGYSDDSSEDFGSFSIDQPVCNIASSAEEVHLFHSKDDPVVQFTELAKFHADLPDATLHIFENRGHFNDATFPELLDLLKQK